MIFFVWLLENWKRPKWLVFCFCWRALIQLVPLKCPKSGFCQLVKEKALSLRSQKWLLLFLGTFQGDLCVITCSVFLGGCMPAWRRLGRVQSHTASNRLSGAWPGHQLARRGPWEAGRAKNSTSRELYSGTSTPHSPSVSVGLLFFFFFNF